mmetsp:Transcript_41594/g.39987  ORF Transcript_41594/g.39987 Transcript_41594/m.39987 type:complete len:118 (-) Transcript_41594:875-1228(-)
MMAYDKIAINYFYLSDLDKAKYYQERMLRGQFEPSDSKLRKIYEAQSKNKKAERNLMGFINTGGLDTKSVFSQFEETLKEQKEMPSTSLEGIIRINLQIKNDEDKLSSLREELLRVY